MLVHPPTGNPILWLNAKLWSGGHSSCAPGACMMDCIQSSAYYGHLEGGGPSRGLSR